MKNLISRYYVYCIKKIFFFSEESKKILNSEEAVLKSGGVFIIGQKPDSLDSSGFFNDRKAFSGKVTQIGLWSKALDLSDIKDLAECVTSNVQTSDLKISWNLQSNWILKNARVSQISDISLLCQRSPLLGQLIWLAPVGQLRISEICRRVEGILPDWRNASGANTLAIKLFKSVQVKLFIMFLLRERSSEV